MGTLTEKAIQIRDEEKLGANTAPRVGGLLEEIAAIIESLDTSSIKKIFLTKGTNDYSELDSYNSPNHLGLYFLYRQKEPALVGFLKIYWTWGGTIVQELESFKMSGAATAMQHTTIMVRWKDLYNSSWSEWKSYQSSFIGSSNVQAGGWTNKDVAPSLEEFLKETAHKKIIEWSGIFRDDDDIRIEESSSINVVPSEIIFSTKLNQFIVYKDGLFFNSWMNKDDTSGNNGQSYFTDEKGFTKNIFKALDGSLWVATSEDTIEKVSSGTVSSSGPVVVRWSGIVVDDVAVLNDMTVAPGAELPSDPENIVFIKAKRTFAYRAYDSFTQAYTYYKKFGNFELYQKNTYTEIEFIAEFTDNIFKDTNGHVWVADSAINIIKLIGDAPEDDKIYGRSNGFWNEIVTSGSGTITVDSELNPNSSNPVKNSAIVAEFNNVRALIPSKLTKLIGKITLTGDVEKDSQELFNLFGIEANINTLFSLGDSNYEATFIDSEYNVLNYRVAGGTGGGYLTLTYSDALYNGTLLSGEIQVSAAKDDYGVYNRIVSVTHNYNSSPIKKNFFPHDFINLRSKNVGDDVSDCLGDNFNHKDDWYANLTYGSGGVTYNVKVDVTYAYVTSPYRYSISYRLFNTLYTFVINASNKTLMEKNIIDIGNSESPIYTIGDIFSLTTSSTNEQIEAVLGSVADFLVAMNAGKLFVCKWGGGSSAPVSVQGQSSIIYIRVIYTNIKAYPNKGDCIDIHFNISNNEWKVTSTTLKTITTTNA